MAATIGPSTPPVPCGESGLAGSVKYSSNHGPRTPWPACKSMCVRSLPEVGVSGASTGIGGIFPQAEIKTQAMSKAEKARYDFIGFLIGSCRIFHDRRSGHGDYNPPRDHP